MTRVNEAGRFLVDIRYAGGSYALHPREIAAGATATFDIRRLRDEQTPDSTGRTLPHTLTIGQIRWSVHGDDSTRLVGRAEVVSRSRRVSNSYSCMCCPNGVYDGRLVLSGTLDEPGDTGQFFAMEREQDCYGNIFGEYGASSQVIFTSGDESMVSVHFSSGEATAIDSGSTYVQGTWTAYRWAEDLHGTCESTPVVMEPISDVLVTPHVEFIDATDDVNTTTFQQPFNTGAILNADCSGAQFRLRVRFRPPPDSELCCTSANSFVTLPGGSNNQFQFAASPVTGVEYEFFGNANPPYADVYLRRRSGGGGTDNRVVITVGGRDTFGQSYSTPATVRLQCP